MYRWGKVESNRSDLEDSLILTTLTLDVHYTVHTVFHQTWHVAVKQDVVTQACTVRSTWKCDDGLWLTTPMQQYWLQATAPPCGKGETAQKKYFAGVCALSEFAMGGDSVNATGLAACAEQWGGREYETSVAWQWNQCSCCPWQDHEKHVRIVKWTFTEIRSGGANLLESSNLVMRCVIRCGKQSSWIEYTARNYP